MTEQKHTLATALLELQALKLGKEQVRRVAVASQGTLHLEIHKGNSQRFFIFEDNALSELLVENDKKIPLIATLRGSNSITDDTLISYRPGRRLVLGSVGDRQDSILKAYKKHKSLPAAKNYAIAQSACDQGGFNIPELLQYETKTDCLVMAKQAGDTPVISSDAVAVWAGIGTCLQRFQSSCSSSGLEEFSSRDELLVLDERARRFLLCMPALPEAWQAGRDRLETALVKLPKAMMGLAHRDLHDGQLIVSGNNISLLDFDLICRADLALDAANLLAHMKLRTLQGRHDGGDSSCSDCSEAFLFGLGRLLDAGFEDRLNFYKATTFYRLGLLYALRPRWSHLTDPLIAEGNSCINSIGQDRRGS
jgi:hypothetical protein